MMGGARTHARPTQMPKPYNSMWEVYCEMIPALIKQCADPTYFTKREVRGRVRVCDRCPGSRRRPLPGGTAGMGRQRRGGAGG
jgi:hypothetical protein